MSNPESIGPADSFVERERRRLVYEVGNCIMSWAGVEHSLCLLFMSLMKLPIENAVAIWDSIVSLEAKLSMLNVVVRQNTTDTDILPIWDKIFVRISKKYRKRHEIAHGCIMVINDERIVFVPYGTMTSIFDSAGRRLSADQIAQRNKSFHELGRAIEWITTSVPLRRDNAVAALPEAPDLVRQLQTLIAQTPVGMPPPPQS